MSKKITNFSEPLAPYLAPELNEHEYILSILCGSYSVPELTEEDEDPFNWV